MKLTVEGIENEKGKYEQYKEVIKKQKERLMKEYTELTSKKFDCNNESNVYKLKFEKAKISQQEFFRLYHFLDFKKQNSLTFLCKSSVFYQFIH